MHQDQVILELLGNEKSGKQIPLAGTKNKKKKKK